MYDLIERGRLGNYPRWWRTIEQIHADGYRGHVSIRSLTRSNPVKLYHVPAHRLAKCVSRLPKEHRDAGLVFSESPPDEKRVIQGEWDGRHLTYSYAKLPMRLAFEQDLRHANGLRAISLLRSAVPPRDFDWMDELLLSFPGHTIEFSTFRSRVGLLSGFTLFWEVRGY